MPLYDFQCEKGHTFERMVTLADFETPQFCACQSPANRVIRPVRFSVEAVDYTCPITDKHISSKKAHEENLSQHDCRVYETGETQAAVRSKAEAEAEFEARLDETVERTIEAMPSDKKEKLANELLAGADIAVERITA
jgi:putative FmdB family regulatory protein